MNELRVLFTKQQQQQVDPLLHPSDRAFLSGPDSAILIPEAIMTFCIAVTFTLDLLFILCSFALTFFINERVEEQVMQRVVHDDVPAIGTQRLSWISWKVWQERADDDHQLLLSHNKLVLMLCPDFSSLSLSLSLLRSSAAVFLISPHLSG